MPDAVEPVDALLARVSIGGVRAAREIVSRDLPVTPLLEYPLLTDAIGFPIRLKHENHLPTGSFKVRGGLNYMANLSEEARARGVITATRGNHGQSIAYAAKSAGVRAVIVVPHGNNPEKNAAMRAYGAELIEHGGDFDEAREYADRRCRDEGLTFVHNADEPDLIHGVGTYMIEILDQWPEVDTVIVPVGGGSGICGVLTVVRALKPDVRVIGVQAANAPSVFLSWKEKRMVETESAKTYADGLATRVPFSLPFRIMQDNADEIVTVEEESIRKANKLIIETTHNLVEGASATTIAAAVDLKDSLQGRNVAAIMTGANIDQATLKWVLEA